MVMCIKSINTKKKFRIKGGRLIVLIIALLTIAYLHCMSQLGIIDKQQKRVSALPLEITCLTVSPNVPGGSRIFTVIHV